MKIIKTFEKFIQDREKADPERYEPQYIADKEDKVDNDDIKGGNGNSDKMQNLTENI